MSYFDSENIPLVTRIEAGTGTTISYKMNSDNESIWITNIDSDYVVSIIEKVISRQEISNVQDISQTVEDVKDIKEAIGLDTEPVVQNPSQYIRVDSDSYAGKVTYSQVGNVLTSNLRVKIKIISFSEDEVYSSDIRLGINTDKNNVMALIQYKMMKSNIVKTYVDSITTNQTRLYFEFKKTYPNFRIEVDVLETSDGSVFTTVL